MVRLLSVVLGMLFAGLAAAQDTYPRHYFRNPLDIPVSLAGNFGECRPGHFHSGLDIKTQGKENMAVHAAADGYISRIKLEPGGFGHAIYITHPNGYTTLYAHLNHFFPALQKRVRQMQYERENWELDYSFKPGEYPVKKGQFIAWSGNTGGSSAPHLHFEIRDSKTEHPLNPQLFGFDIKDGKAPVPLQLALYDLNQSIYEQDPVILRLKKKDNIYVTDRDTIFITTSSAGIGLLVNDYMEGSENTLSVFSVSWSANGHRLGTLKLDDIGYEETRYLNACADYKLKTQSGSWYQSMFLLPGNKLDKIYNFPANENGAIPIPINRRAEVEIALEDNSGNKSQIRFLLVNKGAGAVAGCVQPFRPGVSNSYNGASLKFTLSALDLYDSICFRTGVRKDTGGISPWYKVHEPYVPVHKYFDVYIQPEVQVAERLQSKVVVQYDDGKQRDGRSASLNSIGWFYAAVRNLGDYRLTIDTVPPVIKPLQKPGKLANGQRALRFLITDNLTSAKKCKGYLDGNWICLERHYNEWFYELDERCPKGKHVLEVTATDENGNTRRQSFAFTR